MKVNEFIDWCNANLTEEQMEYEIYFEDVDFTPLGENVKVSDEYKMVVL